ncbi:MAG: hypothetical protein DMG12_10080 [Acidobacteria bacterium]|nr:MAG: hypothetical protein DMG12_10080 [Acidobacteriota bacterium]
MDIIVDAIEGRCGGTDIQIMNFNVPFFPIPTVGAPPVARTPPRAAEFFNGPVNAMEGNPGGDVVSELNGGV